jgi:hypothetical protein
MTNVAPNDQISSSEQKARLRRDLAVLPGHLPISEIKTRFTPHRFETSAGISAVSRAIFETDFFCPETPGSYVPAATDFRLSFELRSTSLLYGSIPAFSGFSATLISKTCSAASFSRRFSRNSTLPRVFLP